MAPEWRPRFNNISLKMRTPCDRLRLPHPRWQEGGEVRAGDSSACQGCSGNRSGCGWEHRLDRPSWQRSRALGKCLNMWVSTNEQTWETQAWASLSRQAGSVPAWACCPDPGRRGDSLQERQVMAAIKAQTGKHLVSLVRWWNPSLTLNGIEKLEWYWISLCGALTIQPVREFI